MTGIDPHCHAGTGDNETTMAQETFYMISCVHGVELKW